MAFIHDNFLLENSFAKQLYFNYAQNQPIIDYHNHLIPELVASNHQFDNLTQLWLDGDHYKWRAMRTWGIDEHFITGEASHQEKFQKWAETVPYMLRNPLYHWTHLELKRYFNVDDLLNASSANAIYNTTKEQIGSENYRVQDLLSKMNVEVICTTDDPLDDLKHHAALEQSDSALKMLPTFRPDAFFKTGSPEGLKQKIDLLSNISSITITDFDSFVEAMSTRHQYFHNSGCRLSDHGLESIPFEDYSSTEIESIFYKVLSSNQLNSIESRKYVTACLLEFAKIEHGLGWVQQFHLGAIRDNNSRLNRILGADSGVDSIGDFSQARGMSRFFDALDAEDKLAKTIIYNLNPADNEVFATMIGNYNDGSIRGKMQFGSGWWFLDQLDGMEKQINTLSNMGILSCFVGMLTDSRSFLSFTRHEYFRRLLCNILGKDIEKGLISNDIQLVGSIVEKICYSNAKNYFNFK